MHNDSSLPEIDIWAKFLTFKQFETSRTQNIERNLQERREKQLLGNGSIVYKLILPYNSIFMCQDSSGETNFHSIIWAK